jgi:hypothetical protein
MNRGLMNKRTSNAVLFLIATLSAGRAAADDPTAAAADPAAAPPTEGAPAGPGAAPGPRKVAPSLSLAPDAPQVGGMVITPQENPAPQEIATSDWKFDITGYFRAPLRMSWGPATLADPNGADVGTQLRTPPLVPDANYIDWRYTNSLVAPWTELNFHYGNDRVKATVQIASYNITDSGYRRLEANLGVNQAYLTLNFPNIINENGRLTLTAGAFTNRYGAAGRYDAGRYETYLFGRTHVAGERLAFEYDVGNWTLLAEQGFGAKLEPIPYRITVPGATNTTQNPWEPYPGPRPQESTFVNHAHVGAMWKRTVLLGAHYIDVFANDIERAGAFGGMAYAGRMSGEPKPRITVVGADLKFLNGPYGDGYLGYSHLDAKNAIYLADALEVLHSFGGWQLHDNYFGVPGSGGNLDVQTTGKIDTVLFQYVFSFGQFFHRPKPFWGDGPDLIAAVFGMYNAVTGVTAPAKSKFKAGAELTYLPLSWFGFGGRFDEVQPNMDDSTQSFAVLSPRMIFRTAFVTHEQVLVQYSRYFYNSNAAHASYPYSVQPGAAGLGADNNAFQIAAIIWF